MKTEYFNLIIGVGLLIISAYYLGTGKVNPLDMLINGILSGLNIGWFIAIQIEDMLK